MAEKFANNAIDRLAGPITSSDTVITVQDASEFPVTGTFRIRIDAELIRVDSVSGNNFTVTRGTEGTIAAAHQGAAAVTHVLTAAVLTNLVTSSIDTTQLKTATIAYTSVNQVEVEGAAAAGTPQIRTIGTDTNIPLEILTKGTGQLVLSSSGGTHLRVGSSATAGTVVNYGRVIGSISGQAPSLLLEGSDTNISYDVISKGTGSINLRNAGGYHLRVGNSNTPVANYVRIGGVTAGNGVILSSEGSDTNIDMRLEAKGNANHLLRNSNGIGLTVTVPAAASVNYSSTVAATTGNSPTILAAGSDTNINLNLSGKGTGRVKVADAPTAGTDVANKTYVDARPPSWQLYLVSPVNETAVVFTLVSLTGLVASNGVTITGFYRVTPNTAGIYQVSANMYIQNGSNPGNILCSIYKNGVERIRGSGGQTTALEFRSTVATGIVEMNGTTDYLELFFIGDGVGTKQLQSGLAFTSFSGFQIGRV